ncbi:thiol reductant ABC exporter subunit CydC [Halomonadaceae bacterium KBTZ08]
MGELLPWLRLLKGHRLQLLAGLILALATILSGLGLLALSGWFITATAVTAAAWAAGMNASLNLYAPGAGIRFFALSRTVSRYLERLVHHDAVLRLLADIRVRVFRGLAGMDDRVRRRLGSAAFLGRLVADVDALDNLYLRLLAPPVVALLASLVAAGLVALFAPLIAVVMVLVLLPLLGLLTLGVALATKGPGVAGVKASERLRVRALEQLEGMAELAAAHRLQDDQRRLAGEEASLRENQYRRSARVVDAQALNTLVLQLLVVVVLLLGGQAWQSGQVSGPVMVMMPLAVMALAEGFAALPMGFARWGTTTASAARLNANSAPVPSALPEAGERVPKHPELSWSGVTVAQGLMPVFQNVSLSLAPGEHVAVTGASGSGKSTLVTLATRTLAPDAGAVLADGRTIQAFQLAQWRSRLAVLTQDAHLFDTSVADNLRIACPAASDEQLWRILEAVRLDGLVAALPQGLETMVGERAGRLSGGEARRLALARTLLKPAPILILDEPFTGLDRDTLAGVWSGIQPWLEGRSLLLLIHELTSLVQVDRSIRLGR